VKNSPSYVFSRRIQVTQPSFAERYTDYIGIASDLPADLAANLDHYIHGHEKK